MGFIYQTHLSFLPCTNWELNDWIANNADQDQTAWISSLIMVHRSWWFTDHGSLIMVCNGHKEGKKKATSKVNAKNLFWKSFSWNTLQVLTYWVDGSVIAAERSSQSSTRSRMASSYKLKLLNVCTILYRQKERDNIPAKK